MEHNSEKLELKNVKVSFYNPKKDGFNESITVTLTPNEEEKVRAWINKAGLSSNIQTYHSDKSGINYSRFTFKINRNTQVIDEAGQPLNPEDCLDGGARVALVARTYPYHSAEYGDGTTHYLTTLIVTTPVKNNVKQVAKQDTQHMLDELSAGQSKDEMLPTEEEIDSADIEVDLDKLPF